MSCFVAIKLIKELTVQRARSELFTMALEVELQSHRHMQKLLTAVLLLLQQISTSLHDRMVSCVSQVICVCDMAVICVMA